MVLTRTRTFHRQVCSTTMLGPWALRGAGRVLSSWQRLASRGGKRRCATQAGAQHVGSAVRSLLGRLGLAGGGAIAGGSSVLALTREKEPTSSSPVDSVPWVQELQEKCIESLPPSSALRQQAEPVARLLGVDKDHLFQSLLATQQVQEFRCFFQLAEGHASNQKQLLGAKFHSVVQLGKDVCGYPQTVHGGLTAAIIDETLGGLGVQLWRYGLLGCRLPAYTARLEVDYKRRIPAGSLILVTTEVEQLEGRKVWMCARVTDGGSTEYARARALFVSPRLPGEGLGEQVQKRLGGLLTGFNGEPSTLS